MRPYRTGINSGSRVLACCSSSRTMSRPAGGSNCEWLSRGTSRRAALPRAARSSALRLGSMGLVRRVAARRVTCLAGWARRGRCCGKAAVTACAPVVVRVPAERLPRWPLASERLLSMRVAVVGAACLAIGAPPSQRRFGMADGRQAEQSGLLREGFPKLLLLLSGQVRADEFGVGALELFLDTVHNRVRAQQEEG